MTNEHDAKRDKKLTATLLAGVVVVLVGGSYYLWSWYVNPAQPVSKVDLTRVSAASRKHDSESPAYRELLKQYNEEGVSTAKSQNSSFIASIPMQQQPVTLPDTADKKTSKPPPTTRSSSRASKGQASGGDKKQETPQALKDLLARINPSHKDEKRPSGLQVALVMGTGAGTTTDYDRWSETLPGGARLQTTALNTLSGGGAEPYSPVEIVPPYWRGAGVIAVGVDSDNSTTPVLGKLSGAYAGAVLKAPEGARLAGDGVVIHFTEMAFKGINYKVDAYALQDDTLLANVATDVNHRYMSRIVLPAVLGGLGNISDLYTQANTQVLSNGFSTEIARPDTPDATVVAGAILGGAASQAAKVLTADAARTPATQVTVTHGQVVAIQFMRGVYAGDAIAPGRSGEAVRSAVKASPLPLTPSQPQTAEQWRAQTQARIEAQRRLQEHQ